MRELHFNRAGDVLTVTFGAYQTTLSWADILPNEHTGQQIYDDAAAYGRQLFDKVFHDPGIRAALLALRVNERLSLVIDDPFVAQLPWEYLRDPDNRLLASRLNLVRFVPSSHPTTQLDMAQPLTLIAIPVSPVDEVRVLNTEREWRRLIEAVHIPGKTLTLQRVRPPTLAQMEQDLPETGLSIVHFMGHSGRLQGNSVLVFEDALACSLPIDAAYFADSLNERVLLVVLNSCLSATVFATEFGNIAQSIVRHGVPYAVGMQFVLPDDAALEMSKTLYLHLLQGRSVEEAVRRTRRALEQNTLLHQPPWVAGIPVVYTHLREPAPALTLASGSPTVLPDPEHLQTTCDLTALPRIEHFVGRGREMSEALKVLLAPAGRGFVLLHGLGGIGKTSLAHALAERVSWYYRDHVLAISFETFVSYDQDNTPVISETFADRFYNRLARFYGLDPARSESIRDLQDAILQKRTRFRSLLILDNMETLIAAQKEGNPTALALATFISRLCDGDGMILITSRSVPPSDWGECATIPLSGLTAEAGADLFLSLLPEDRQAAAKVTPPRLQLTRRVQGHPLSLRLLAGRFAEMPTPLETFLQHIEQELKDAEQATPTSLEDPNRQKTLYACIDYSIRHLSMEQKQLLHACNLFIAPFPSNFLTSIFPDTDKQHLATTIQQLVRLGLLEQKTKTLPEGNLFLLDLHAMLRWYIQFSFSELPETWLKQYGQLYSRLARQSYQPEGGYDQNPTIRFLMRQSLPDCDRALQYVELKERAAFAFYLAEPYLRLGQPRRARVLYEQALEAYQELGEMRGVSVTQNALAGLLSQQGRVQEAMELYEASLQTVKELGDVRGVSATQHELAGLLRQQGRVQEAMELYEASLQTVKELGDVRGVAVTQANMSQLLFQSGVYDRALSLAWHSYTSLNQRNYTPDAQGVQNLLISMKQADSERFDTLWAQSMSEPQPEWLHSVPTSVSSSTVPKEVVSALKEFLNTPTWEKTHQVLLQRKDILFQPEAEAILEQLLAAAHNEEDTRQAKLFNIHLELLRDCKARGIETAFEQFLQTHTIPFDPELIPRSITALQAEPAEKLAYAQSLNTLASETADGELKKLFSAIQLALFGGDLSQHGKDLQGIYREAYNAIIAGVKEEK